MLPGLPQHHLENQPSISLSLSLFFLSLLSLSLSHCSLWRPIEPRDILGIVIPLLRVA